MTKQKQVTVLPSADTVISIELAKIFPSLFEPQARRRARFKDSELETLGDSIIKQGLFSPIVVKPQKDGNFEIVFGERRYLACKLKGLESINAFVKDVSDAQILELQYEENHRRQENHPLDDAYLFKYLKDTEGYTNEQLADRLNTSKTNIVEKLKLNDLVSDAARQLEDGKLPLRHAYYMAKFPEATQRIICEENYAFRYGDADDSAAPFDEFREEVEEHILRQLADAPFDPSDPRLHIKKLICANCEERTGFAPLLFPDLTNGDSCLNKSCFEIKTNTHLKIKRAELAAALPAAEEKPLEEAIKEVPLVTDRSWFNEDTPFGREKPLLDQKFLDKPECEFSEISLIVGGARKGEETYICRAPICPVHHALSEQAETSERSERELKKLETDFEVKVRMRVREKIFTESLDFFDYNKLFWIYQDLVEHLITECLFSKRMYLKSSFPEILSSFPHCPKNFDDSAKTREFVKSLDIRQQSRLLFLCTFANLDFMSWRPEPLENVKKLAEDYYPALDYDLLDAETRLELAPEEFRAAAEKYLAQVEEGKPAEIPHFWWNESEQDGEE